MILNPDIFREYDIRGVYKDDFSEDFSELLGYHYSDYLKKILNKKIITLSVGYDARLSSPSLTQALIDGITKAGCNVILLDLITSPISYFSCFQIPDLDGSIMITGSHNPKNHNGFKISIGKTTLHGETIQLLKKLILENSTSLLNLKKSGRISTFDIITPYVEKYSKEFNNKFPNQSVAFDCGNGAAGSVLPQLFTALNCKGQILFSEPDGGFPNHHPDPSIKENLSDLSQCVLNNKYSVGIGFDGDADRIGVVDNLGRHIYVDQFMILYAQSVLKEFPHSKIIGDVKCSQIYYDKIKEFGGHPIMWKTGHSLIKEKVRIEKSPFGGELSGHVFFNDRNYGYDDAIYAGFRLLEALENSKLPLSNFIDQLPKTHTSPELRLEVPERLKFKIVDDLVSKVKKTHSLGRHKITELTTIDGYRGQIQGGWTLVRTSNTQAAITIRFEAESEVLLHEMKEDLSKELNLKIDF